MKKRNLYSYIKIVLAVFMLIFIILELKNDKISKTKIETVTETVLKTAKMDAVEPAEGRMIKRFYGLNPNDYAGTVLYAPKDNMDVHEMLIVKLKDVAQSRDVKDAVEKRLDTQLKSFQGYGAEQTALLKKHVLQVKGNYVFYMVGEHAKDAEKAFLKSL